MKKKTVKDWLREETMDFEEPAENESGEKFRVWIPFVNGVKAVEIAKQEGAIAERFWWEKTIKEMKSEDKAIFNLSPEQAYNFALSFLLEKNKERKK